MIDMKPQILAALRGNETLAALLGKDAKGVVKVYPEVAPEGTAEPYVTFFEITNFDDVFADDQAAGSEVHFQIDIWTKGNTSQFAFEVDETMKGIGFFRTSSGDLYDSDTKTYHKAMRYKIKLVF